MTVHIPVDRVGIGFVDEESYMRELLIGFDVREMWTNPQDIWDSERRNIFLIREDIIKPLSVDNVVWNSAFQLLNIEIPSDVGYRQSIWADLYTMRQSISSFLVPENYEYWEVGITQFIDDRVAEETGTPYLPLNPPTVDNEWQFLGYDVAELNLLSGLSNMGYRPEIKLKFYNEFSKYLNNYHLFDDEKMSHKFAEWNQTRDTGHGSFYVTGIYKISEKRLS